MFGIIPRLHVEYVEYSVQQIILLKTTKIKVRNAEHGQDRIHQELHLMKEI